MANDTLNQAKQWFHVVDVRQADGEHVPLLLDDQRLPIAWANTYSLAARRPVVAASTLARELRVLGYLYAWGAHHGIDIMQRLSSGEGFTRDEIANQLFDWMRKDFRDGKVTALVAGRKEVDFRMAKAWQFMKWELNNAISRLPNGDVRIDHIKAKMKIIEDTVKSLETSHGRAARKEALPHHLVERLLEVCHPGHPDNPSQKNCRERNYLILVLLLTFALRRGELLVLYTTDCKTSGAYPAIHVVRRPDNPIDPRADAPQVKTQPRILPMAPRLAQHLHAYILNERDKIPGTRKHPFLIVSERNGAPLGLRGVNEIFEQIAARFPEFAGLTPHILRHTCDTELTEEARRLGIPEDRLVKHLKYYNGWLGDNSETYTQLAIRNEAHRLSREYQKRLFESGQDGKS